MFWPFSASTILALLEIPSLKDFVVSYCWKSYVYFFVSCFKFFIFIFFFPIFNFFYFIFNFISSQLFCKNSINWFYVLCDLVLQFLKPQLYLFIFSNSLPRGEHCYVILLFSDRNISSPVRYSFLSTLPDNNTDISAASLLISHCSFSSLILSSIVIISLKIASKTFCLKREEVSDARVVSFTKKYNMF